MARRIIVIGERGKFASKLLARLMAADFETDFVVCIDSAIKACRHRKTGAFIVVDEDAVSASNTTRALRLHPATNQHGLIVLTQESGRLAAMQSGADDVFSMEVSAELLIARLRILSARPVCRGRENMMAEGGALFLHRPKIALIAADDVAKNWEDALSPHLDADFEIMSRDACLIRADGWQGAELYLIARDLGIQSDGMQLLSILRRKPALADSGYLIALAPDEGLLAPVALDLGAGDVLPLSLSNVAVAKEAAIRIKNQLHYIAKRKSSQSSQAETGSLKDPLTGLLSRRHALNKKPAIIENITKSGKFAAVIILGVDDFVQLTVRYGKQFGEEVLKAVASGLTKSVPAPAMIARLGRDEILVVLATHSACDAFTQADELRRMLQAKIQHITHRKKRLPTPPSLSAGLAVSVTNNSKLAPNSKNTTRMPLMASADLALLSARQKGGNRTECNL